MKTEIIKMNSSKAIPKSVEILNKGGIIIYPTETLYGIGVDATNDKAVLKLIKIKKRTGEKKFLTAF